MTAYLFSVSTFCLLKKFFNLKTSAILNWVKCNAEANRPIKRGNYHYWQHFRLTKWRQNWCLLNWVINVLKWIGKFCVSSIEKTRSSGLCCSEIYVSRQKGEVERWHECWSSNEWRMSTNWHKWKVYSAHATITQRQWAQLCWGNVSNSVNDHEDKIDACSIESLTCWSGLANFV